MTSQGWRRTGLKPAKSPSCYSESAPQTSESRMHLNVHIFCRSQKPLLLLAKQHISLIWCERNMLHSFMNRMLTSTRINIYIQEHNELACFVLHEFKTRTLGKSEEPSPPPKHRQAEAQASQKGSVWKSGIGSLPGPVVLLSLGIVRRNQSSRGSQIQR